MRTKNCQCTCFSEASKQFWTGFGAGVLITIIALRYFALI